MSDYDPDYPDYSRYTRYALTNSMKNKIKDAVGNKCEKCNKRFENFELNVHHIYPVKNANGMYDLNSPNNLIVLCSNCHQRADMGKIHPVELVDIISNRPDTVKNTLNDILKDRKLAIATTPKLYQTDKSSIQRTNTYNYSSSSETLSTSHKPLFDAIFICIAIVPVFFILCLCFLSNGLMGDIRNWLISVINPNGLSVTITEAILGLILILFFICISVLIPFIIKSVIKRVGYRESLGFIYDNPTLYNFIIKSNNFVITSAIILFILFTILPLGIMSQAYAGENVLFKNILLGSINSILNSAINILAFIITALISLVCAVILLMLVCAVIIFLLANRDGY